MKGRQGHAPRAQQLAVLHDIALELQATETVDETCHQMVAAAEDVLEFDRCIVALNEGGELPVHAQSTALSPDGVTPTMAVDEGITGETYRTGTSYRIDHHDSDCTRTDR